MEDKLIFRKHGPYRFSETSDY